MMNDPNHNIDQIEAYVMGQMEPEVRAAFEAELQADKKLAEAVALHRLLMQQLGDADQNQFRADVRRVIEEGRENGGSEQKEAIVRSMPRWALLATAIVIALIGFFAWFVIDPKVQPDQLFAAHFEPYPVYQINRSEDHNPEFQEAMELYGADRFDEAGDLLSSLSSDDREEQASISFYRAMTLLQSGNHVEAQRVLRPIASTSDSRFRQQSTWYLALSLIHSGDLDEAQNLLESLTGDPGRIGKDARNLLKKID